MKAEQMINPQDLGSISFHSSFQEQPTLLLESNGDIYVKGRLVENDKEVVDALRVIMHGGKLPTSTIRVKILKEVGYHDLHQPGEVITINLTDVNHLVKEGYAEVYVTKEGYNI